MRFSESAPSFKQFNQYCDLDVCTLSLALSAAFFAPNSSKKEKPQHPQKHVSLPDVFIILLSADKGTSSFYCVPAACPGGGKGACDCLMWSLRSVWISSSPCVQISCYEKEFVFRWSQILYLLRAALKAHGCDSFQRYGAAIPRFPPPRCVPQLYSPALGACTVFSAPSGSLNPRRLCRSVFPQKTEKERKLRSFRSKNWIVSIGRRLPFQTLQVFEKRFSKLSTGSIADFPKNCSRSLKKPFPGAGIFLRRARLAQRSVRCR